MGTGRRAAQGALSVMGLIEMITKTRTMAAIIENLREDVAKLTAEVGRLKKENSLLRNQISREQQRRNQAGQRRQQRQRDRAEWNEDRWQEYLRQCDEYVKNHERQGRPQQGRPESSLPREQPYLVLGLDPACSFADVKARYRELALMYHPDKNPKKPSATEDMRQINAAYAEICRSR